MMRNPLELELVVMSQLEHAFRLHDGAFRLLVAVSGGADSVALLHALLRSGCHCEAAHCNFGLRGVESDRDERFVRDLCLRLDVPLHVARFDVADYRREHGGSVEMACRELRYAWFERLRAEHGLEAVAVAHHQGDNVETMLFNLMRGTGIAGLAGMNLLHEGIVRPLLGITRREIEDYLRALGESWITDSTNALNDFSRNRIRNLILPEMERQFPCSARGIVTTMHNLADTQKMAEELAAGLEADLRLLSDFDDVTAYRLDALKQYHSAPSILYEWVKHLGFTRSQCTDAVRAATGARFFAGDWQMSVAYDRLEIARCGSADREYPLDFNSPAGLPVRLVVEQGATAFSPSLVDGRNTVALDASVLSCGRVVLRHWRRGDRMRPFGMKGTKLLSDLFADLRLSVAERSRVWLLEADGEILWLLGHRAAAGYAVGKGSTDYLLLTVNPHRS